jgi:hypothetical protein
MKQAKLLVKKIFVTLLAFAWTPSTLAFVVQPNQIALRQARPNYLQASAFDSLDYVQQSATSILSDTLSSSSSTLTLGAISLDPTTFFTGVFGAFLNTPLILAVPIVAALGIAGLLAFLLIQYSQPAEDD